MDKPKIAACFPQQVELEAGKKYAYCTCGHSTAQPFCDGSHKGTEFKPIVFESEQTRTAYFCQCKHTGNPPECDGTHKTVEATEGDPGPNQII